MTEPFNERLRKLRELRGLSVREVARAIGVAESTYREWEYGRSIKGEPYLKLAQALGVSLEEIFGAKNSERAAEQIIENIFQDLRTLRLILQKERGEPEKPKKKIPASSK